MRDPAPGKSYMSERLPPVCRFRGADYAEADLFDRIAAAVVRAEPCAVTGAIGPDEIKLALAEHGDVWPASVLNDAIDARIAELGVRPA
jgi:hypothetical protein